MPSSTLETREAFQDGPSLVIDREWRKSGWNVGEGVGGMDIAGQGTNGKIILYKANKAFMACSNNLPDLFLNHTIERWWILKKYEKEL